MTLPGHSDEVEAMVHGLLLTYLNPDLVTLILTLTLTMQALLDDAALPQR